MTPPASRPAAAAMPRIPMAKMAATPIFLCRDILSDQMARWGIKKIRMSVAKLTAPAVVWMAPMFTRPQPPPGISRFQFYS